MIESREKLIRRAERAIVATLQEPGPAVGAPSLIKRLAVLRLARLDHEVFEVAFLDARNRLIELAELASGTLTQTAVYPREVVKAALRCNAAGAILMHNHPSGAVEPSLADHQLTATLKDALQLVGCTVHDHVIVAGAAVMTFRESGFELDGSTAPGRRVVFEDLDDDPPAAVQSAPARTPPKAARAFRRRPQPYAGRFNRSTVGALRLVNLRRGVEA